MNERIRRLLNEATSGLEPDLSKQRTVTLNEMEKFAELIVQECLNQCYNRGMDDELYAGQLKAATYIEEYFGVKE